MRLLEAQQNFAIQIPHLIVEAQNLGFEVTLGDAYRDPRVFGMFGTAKGYGRALSNHKRRLAIDLNLFRDGEYLDQTTDHQPLGMWWERHGEKVSLPLVWGGNWGDGNHYSMRFEGRW